MRYEIWDRSNMTHCLGRNNFVGTELAAAWLRAGNKNMRTSHLSQLQISLAQLFYISIWWFNSTFLIPHWRKVAAWIVKVKAAALCFVYSAEKISNSVLWLLCLCRFAVLILAALDPFLEMSPDGRFQFIIMLLVGGGRRWEVVGGEGKLFTDIGDDGRSGWPECPGPDCCGTGSPLSSPGRASSPSIPVTNKQQHRQASQGSHTERKLIHLQTQFRPVLLISGHGHTTH